ncbi:MAG: TetR/AcrR family transcriptional regulator [Pseudomonadota bacterium]
MRERDRPGTRERLVRAAARLFQERGYGGVGLSEILSLADAPKGSLYHHFPEGKTQLARAALEMAGDRLEASLAQAREAGGDAANMVEGFAGLLAGWLEASNFTQGCPVATIALEQAGQPGELTDTVAAIFRRWRETLRLSLLGDGIAQERADALANLALSAIEGALILARAERNGDLVRRAAGEIAALIRTEPRAQAAQPGLS